MIRSSTPVTAPGVAIGAAMKQPRETANTHGPVTPTAAARLVRCARPLERRGGHLRMRRIRRRDCVPRTGREPQATSWLSGLNPVSCARFRGIAIARPAPQPPRKQSRGSCHDATTGVVEMSPKQQQVRRQLEHKGNRPAGTGWSLLASMSERGGDGGQREGEGVVDGEFSSLVPCLAPSGLVRELGLGDRLPLGSEAGECRRLAQSNAFAGSLRCSPELGGENRAAASGGKRGHCGEQERAWFRLVVFRCLGSLRRAEAVPDRCLRALAR